MKKILFAFAVIFLAGRVQAQDLAEGGFIGNENAPNKMEVFYSAGCSHCLHFLDSYAGIFRRGADAGRLRIEFIEVPGAVGPGPLDRSARTANAQFGSRALICLANKEKREDESFDYLAMLNAFMLTAQAVVKTRGDWQNSSEVSWQNWANASAGDLAPGTGNGGVREIADRIFEAFGQTYDSECEALDFAAYGPARWDRMKAAGSTSTPFYTLNGTSQPAAISIYEAVYGEICSGAQACFDRAWTFRKGQGVQKDLFLATALFEKSCTLGEPNACFNAGLYHYREAGADGLGSHYSVALRWFKDGCALNSANSCDFTGDLYRLGHGVARNRTTAFGYFEKGCALGNLQSCDYAGDYAMYGWGIEADLPRALGFYEKACAAGNGESCTGAGFLFYSKSNTIEEDTEKALGYFTKACDLSHARACNLAGTIYNSNVPFSDRAKSAGYHVKGCELGDGSSCHSAGLMYEYGVQHGSPDFARAISFYERACEENSASGCGSAGRLLREGKAGPPDLGHVADLFARGCARLNTQKDSCLGLALALEKGEGVAQNRARAIETLEPLCSKTGYKTAEVKAACARFGLGD